MMRQAKLRRVVVAMAASGLLSGGAFAERVILEAASGPTPGGEIEIVRGEFVPSPNESDARYLTPDVGSLRLQDAGTDSDFAVDFRPQLPYTGAVRVSIAYPDNANVRGLVLRLENVDPPQTFPVRMQPNHSSEWHVVGTYFPGTGDQPVFRLASTGELAPYTPALPINVFIDGIRFDPSGDVVPRTGDENPFAAELETESPFVEVDEEEVEIAQADSPFAVEYDEAESPFVSPEQDVAETESPFAVEYDPVESPFVSPEDDVAEADSPFAVEYDEAESPFAPVETVEIDLDDVEPYEPADSMALPQIDVAAVGEGEYDLLAQGLPVPREILPPMNALASALVTARSTSFAASGVPSTTRPQNLYEVAVLDIRDPATERPAGTIDWVESLEEARQIAREHRRPMVVVFLGRNRASDEVAATQLTHRGLAEVMNRMVPVKLDIDAHAEVARHHAVPEAPYAVVLSPEGFTRAHMRLDRPARNLVQDLQVLAN